METMFKQSIEIAKLAEALAKAQGEFERVSKDAENPFFSKPNRKASYADMASVIAATRPALSKYGLSVIQSPRSTLTEGQRCVVVSTMLIHSSGEWIADELAVPIEKTFTAQSVGSAVTYARRYALQAFLCVAGEDDDGNAAVGNKERTPEEEKEFAEDFEQRTAEQTAIAPFQQKAIQAAMEKSGKTEGDLTTYLGLIGHKRIEHVLKSEFNDLLKWANGNPNGKQIAAVILEKPKPDLRTKAMSKLFAVAAEYSIPEGDVRRAAYEKYTVDSMTKLSIDQLEGMVEWVKEVSSVA